MSSKALKWIAFIVFGAALVAGLMPVTSQGENCGSAFIASRDASVADLTQALMGRDGDAAASCEDLRSILRIPAIIMLGISVITLIGSGLASGKEEEQRKLAREADKTGGS
jgi:hypothetical protein